MSTGGKEGDLVLADVLRLPGQIGFDILEDDPGAANHGFLRSKGDMGSQQGINDVVSLRYIPIWSSAIWKAISWATLPRAGKSPKTS